MRKGLDLLFHDYQLNCDFNLDFQQFACQDGLVNLSFCLAGQYAGSMPGFDRPLEIVVRQTSLATAPDVSGTVSLKKKNSIRVVELVMEPALAIAY